MELPTGSFHHERNRLYPIVDAATLGNEYCYSGAGAGNFTASVVDKIVLCKRGGNARR